MVKQTINKNIAPSPNLVRKNKPKSSKKIVAIWDDSVQSRAALNEAKRLALIRAAGYAFKAKGFHHTSLDEVAAALNVTKPTLYYYAKSKQDLLYQCHDYALDLGEESLEHATLGVNGLDKLQRSVLRYIELITNQFYAYSLLSDLSDLTEPNRKAIQKRRRHFDTIYRSFVEEGIQDGSIRPCDPKLAVFWFMGAINAIPRWFSNEGELDGSSLAKIYSEFIAQGLSASQSAVEKKPPRRREIRARPNK
jgi:TetR/AcrR family transcriptional regulator